MMTNYMKYQLAILASLLFTAAWANPIGRGEARELAQLLVGIDDNTSDDVPVAPYYVFSRGAGRGFVIVSGDDSTAPILGYTDAGDFTDADLPIQLKQMLKAWAEKITAVQAAPRKHAAKRNARERLDAARRGVEGFKASWPDVRPMIETHWHQSSPYNDLCPVNPANTSQRAVSGCLATAAAQIAYYFRRNMPAGLLYDTPTYTINWGGDWGNYPVTESLPEGTPVEYDKMRPDYNGVSTAAERHAVAVLMYALGAYSQLNYGQSTGGSGSTTSEVLERQFQLTNNFRAKSSGYSQAGWEQAIYSSLKTRRPLLYTGANDEAGGHAVVLDGYQAATGLYHFNFGWGGSGDGYYTVDDETGMNGFNTAQAAALMITPKDPKITATMAAPDMYSQATSTVKVVVENGGTLDYTGVNFYVNTTRAALPTIASRSNTDVIAAGESAEIAFEYKPTSARDAIYLFVTDKDKNILDSCSVRVIASNVDMHLNSISVDAGAESTTVDGMDFALVNNTTATVTATFTNGEEGTRCQPRLTCHLSSYDTTTKTWREVSAAYERDTIFEKNDTKTISFEFKKLTEGTCYMATIDHDIRAGTSYELKDATTDTIVRFVVRNPDLRVAIDGRKAVVEGKWNAALFTSLCDDASICSYDMRSVTDLTETPPAANPNAVFYTSKPVAGANNVVSDGQCEQLIIHADSDFMPAEPFHAARAEFILAEEKAGVLGDALLPFAVDIPYGMQAKSFTSVGTTVVNSESVRHVEAMTPILYMSARDGMNRLAATDVSIGTTTEAQAASGQLKAHTLATGIDARAMILGTKNNAAYYLPAGVATTLPPFKTLIVKYDASGFRAVSTSETRYPELAASINRACQAMDEHTLLGAEASLQQLKDAIKEATDMFTYMTAEKSSDIRNQCTALDEALAAFLDAVATGISSPSAPASGAEQPAVEYYSPSGVRLSSPTRGVVIVRQGGTTRKIYVK